MLTQSSAHGGFLNRLLYTLGSPAAGAVSCEQKRGISPGHSQLSGVMVRGIGSDWRRTRHIASPADALGEILDMVQRPELLKCGLPVGTKVVLRGKRETKTRRTVGLQVF